MLYAKLLAHSRSDEQVYGLLARPDRNTIEDIAADIFFTTSDSSRAVRGRSATHWQRVTNAAASCRNRSGPEPAAGSGWNSARKTSASSRDFFIVFSLKK